MGERDPEFFKLHYRQWRRRMHKARVPYDLQGALLAIVIETHLTGGPPAHDRNTLAGVMMTSPRQAMRCVERLATLGLVRVEDGLVVDKTAVEDAQERAYLRAVRAAAGREGGLKSGQKRQDRTTAEPPRDQRVTTTLPEHDQRVTSVGREQDHVASPKPLKSQETCEANPSNCLNKSREEKSREIDDDGSTRARAREETAQDPVEDEAPFGKEARLTQDPEIIKATRFRNAILEAAGVDISKDRNPGRWLGSSSLYTIQQWLELGLSLDEMLREVAAVMANKPDGPPKSLSYFNDAMRKAAGAKKAPALTPSEPPAPKARRTKADDRFARKMAWAQSADDRAAGRAEADEDMADGEGGGSVVPLLPARGERGG